MDTPRDRTLDIMRGLAVFLMVQGNMAGGIFEHPYPTWIQVYVALGSFVPALFILIVGMIVVYTAVHKGYTLKHFLWRALGVAIAAALVLDVLVWRIVPLVGFDVLYLIALALPASYIFMKASPTVRWVIIGFIFLATPVLQHLFGYADTPVTVPLSLDPQVMQYVSQAALLKHWLIDGWFPVFPWLGFAFLGVNLGLMRWKTKVLETFANKDAVFAGVAITVLGAIIWMTQSQDVFIREGYSESIYPPTLGYIVTAFGQILLLFSLVDWNPKRTIYKPFIVFGQSALFMYIFHYALMEYVWPVLTSQAALLTLIVISLVLLLALGYVLHGVRKKHPKRHVIFKYFGI